MKYLKYMWAYKGCSYIPIDGSSFHFEKKDDHKYRILMQYQNHSVEIFITNDLLSIDRCMKNIALLQDGSIVTPDELFMSKELIINDAP